MDIILRVCIIAILVSVIFGLNINKHIIDDYHVHVYTVCVNQRVTKLLGYV